REHGRPVAALGLRLELLVERMARGQIVDKRFAHPRDAIRLRDRLPVADRQRGILVRSARERLVDEQMTRHRADPLEHTLVRDAFRAKPLDEPLARARRGHTYAYELPFDHPIFSSQSRIDGSARWSVRSIFSGVIETLPFATA